MLTEENLSDLEAKGYTVVPSVLPPEECDKYIDMYNRWLRQFGYNKWPKTARSLIRGYNTGHLEPTWRIRLGVKGVFSQVWKTEKLFTSIDAIAIGRPPEDGAESFDNGSSHWLHLDQESTRDGLHAYQGAVYLEEACEDDWTLQVMEKSHKVFETFFDDDESAAKISHEKQFFRLSENQVKYFEKHGCEIKRVPVPKGGVVLWDSRLVHANAQPKHNRKHPGRWRYVVFVSMTPAIWASEEDLAIKKEAYEKLIMTNHWSSDGSTLLKETRDSSSFPKKRYEIATSSEVKRLCGILPYNFSDGKSNGPPKPVRRVSVRRKVNETGSSQ
ncbi:hypothetical protein ACJMK2_006179 [Sinanodonta woodiana]|uniref:Phytanoyl-CoA dioxygenase n=1 Tax=Sinanodonta woodiana TaxID=1069815 RepID=A0ABD3VVV0_SINWO